MSAAKGKYKPYPKYKDSGVEWLGWVPEHWDVKRLRYCTQLNPSPTDLSPDLEVSFLPMEAIGEDGSLKLDQTRTVKEIGTSYTYFADNDVAYAKVTPCLENGKGALMRGLTNGHGFGTSEITILRPISIDGRFLDFIRRSHCFVGPATSVMLGAGGLKRVPELFARDYYSPFPPPTEQTAIADFIERECGRMDKLVEKKQEFIALLKEKRQALITHAVTKGLDPNVEMKDSGVEWLGKVPKHWRVEKLMWHFRASKGKNAQQLSKEYCLSHPGKYPVYSGQTGNDGIMANIDTYEFDAGNEGVIFSTTVGAKAMELSLLKGKFSLSQNCMIINPISEFCLSHFYRFHFMPLFKYERGIIPDHMQASFRIDDLHTYWIALPPPNEQMEILGSITRESSRIERLINKTEESIALLKERKTSLITAAVTGQIDVS